MANTFTTRQSSRWLWMMLSLLAISLILVTATPVHASEADLAIPDLRAGWFFNGAVNAWSLLFWGALVISVVSLVLNKKLWDGLGRTERSVIETAAAAENVLSYADFTAHDAIALQQIANDPAVEVRKLDDSILEALGKMSGEVLHETSRKDDLTRRVYDSFIKFRAPALRWDTSARDEAQLIGVIAERGCRQLFQEGLAVASSKGRPGFLTARDRSTKGVHPGDGRAANDICVRSP